MSRIRTIKPEFPQSESMGRVSRDARLLFIQLWTLADDSGRLRGNSRMLASLLFPYDDDAPGLIDTWISELVREECITPYEVEGQHFIQITNWIEHQKIDKPSPSRFPAPREDSRGFESPRESSGLDQGPRTKDLGPRSIPASTSDAAPIPAKTPEPRHEYGPEKNVLLTDKQYESLLADLGETVLKACIDELSTAKAMKGYKYKRDDLAIRKWVVDAVKNKQRGGSHGQSTPNLRPEQIIVPDFGGGRARAAG
jgi:hypothetical protein